MKAWFLKLHRWLALLVALPLLVVIGTGLALSIEPWIVVRSIEAGSLDPAKVEAILAQHDPKGQARALAYRSYDGTLSLMAGRQGGTVVDVASNAARPGPSATASFLRTMRGLHETLLLDAGWLVIGSTGAMLAIMILGVLMGLPRFANTLGGWHRGAAWVLLPLLVLSPLTGLLMASGVTFTAPPPSAPEGSPLALVEAVRIVAKDHDLSNLVWLRSQRGRLLVRLVENGEYRVYAVTREGARSLPRNWPRLWHEGNFAGTLSAAMNVVLSTVMLGLLGTGGLIWIRRKLRYRRRS